MPTALLLIRENATVTVCHSKTKDIKAHMLNADIVVAAIGQPLFVCFLYSLCSNVHSLRRNVRR